MARLHVNAADLHFFDSSVSNSRRHIPTRTCNSFFPYTDSPEWSWPLPLRLSLVKLYSVYVICNCATTYTRSQPRGCPSFDYQDHYSINADNEASFIRINIYHMPTYRESTVLFTNNINVHFHTSWEKVNQMHCVLSSALPNRGVWLVRNRQPNSPECNFLNWNITTVNSCTSI